MNNQPMPSTGFKYQQIEIYGNSCLVVVPDVLPNEHFLNTLSRAVSFLTIDIDAGVACSCKKGTGCKLDKTSIPLYGTIYYCNAGDCTKCAMSF
jgi:hypothetical protein